MQSEDGVGSSDDATVDGASTNAATVLSSHLRLHVANGPREPHPADQRPNPPHHRVTTTSGHSRIQAMDRPHAMRFVYWCNVKGGASNPMCPLPLPRVNIRTESLSSIRCPFVLQVVFQRFLAGAAGRHEQTGESVVFAMGKYARILGEDGGLDELLSLHSGFSLRLLGGGRSHKGVGVFEMWVKDMLQEKVAFEMAGVFPRGLWHKLEIEWDGRRVKAAVNGEVVEKRPLQIKEREGEAEGEEEGEFAPSEPKFQFPKESHARGIVLGVDADEVSRSPLDGAIASFKIWEGLSLKKIWELERREWRESVRPGELMLDLRASTEDHNVKMKDFSRFQHPVHAGSALRVRAAGREKPPGGEDHVLEFPGEGMSVARVFGLCDYPWSEGFTVEITFMRFTDDASKSRLQTLINVGGPGLEALWEVKLPPAQMDSTSREDSFSVGASVFPTLSRRRTLDVIRRIPDVGKWVTLRVSWDGRIASYHFVEQDRVISCPHVPDPTSPELVLSGVSRPIVIGGLLGEDFAGHVASVKIWSAPLCGKLPKSHLYHSSSVDAVIFRQGEDMEPTWVEMLPPPGSPLNERDHAEGSPLLERYIVKNFPKRKYVFECRANNLDKMDIIGLSDPYFLIYQGPTRVFKSAIHKVTLCPDFGRITAEIMLEPGHGERFRLDVYDWDRIGSDDFIGSFEFRLDDLLWMPKPIEFVLVNPKKRGSDKTSGVFIFESFCLNLVLTASPPRG